MSDCGSGNVTKETGSQEKIILVTFPSLLWNTWECQLKGGGTCFHSLFQSVVTWLPVQGLWWVRTSQQRASRQRDLYFTEAERWRNREEGSGDLQRPSVVYLQWPTPFHRLPHQQSIHLWVHQQMNHDPITSLRLFSWKHSLSYKSLQGTFLDLNRSRI